eukprot:2515085-Alexandrium_andersonii.AAC.1
MLGVRRWTSVSARTRGFGAQGATTRGLCRLRGLGGLRGLCGLCGLQIHGSELLAGHFSGWSK